MKLTEDLNEPVSPAANCPATAQDTQTDQTTSSRCSGNWHDKRLLNGKLPMGQFDLNIAIEKAIFSLEDAQKKTDGGTDQNLVTAIEVLKTYEPSVSGPGLDPAERTAQEQEVRNFWNDSVAPVVAAHAQ